MTRTREVKSKYLGEGTFLLTPFNDQPNFVIKGTQLGEHLHFWPEANMLRPGGKLKTACYSCEFFHWFFDRGDPHSFACGRDEEYWDVIDKLEEEEKEK